MVFVMDMAFMATGFPNMFQDIYQVLIRFFLNNSKIVNIEAELKKVEIDDFENIKYVIENEFYKMQSILKHSQTVDCNYSGTTFSSIMILKRTLISINVGDSRAVIARC